MASIKINPGHREIDALHDRIQTIEGQLRAHQRISPQTKELLFQELDGAQQALLSLRAKSVSITQYSKSKFSSSFETAQNERQIEELDRLKEKIITLYGDIDTRATDSEIEEIKEETCHLQQALKEGNPEEIAKDVSILSKHIHTFCDTHQASRKDRHIINLAKQSLKTADTILHQKVLGQTVNQFNILSLLRSEMIEECEEDEELEPQVMELFNAAELFYSFKIKEAKSAFNQFPESIKARARHHLSVLEKGTEIGSNVIKTVQALVATAHEIAQSDEDYLTTDQVHEMFKEVSALNSEEASANQEQQTRSKQFWLQA